jgi:hypothetical protein
MKAVVATWFVLAVAVGIASSCSITHKSDALACTKQSDCAGGRQCINGYCVVSGEIDAPAPPPDGMKIIDADLCPAQCTKCEMSTMTCTIDCAGGGGCDATVTCPAGWNCNILCDVGNSCRAGVDCTQGASCDITCSGTSSCRGVVCGLGRCDVTCSGASSCRGVDCSESCACDVACSGPQSCANGAITCAHGFECRGGSTTILGCTSMPNGCDTCP